MRRYGDPNAYRRGYSSGCFYKVRRRTVEVRSAHDRKGVETMIDWESATWGGTVHLAANGSWVADKHGLDTDDQD
ncbi:hypothetical protein ACVW00_000326 [Marmoricola sp. URHA0025 HA25]